MSFEFLFIVVNSTLTKLSEYSYPHQSMVSHVPGSFPFSQTEPSDLLSGSWGNTTEGSQPFQDYTEHGSCHSGEAEDYIVRSGQTTPRGTKLDRLQTMENTWANSGLAPSVTAGAQAMSRVNSCRSTGSSLSRTSHPSNLGMRGNVNAFRNGSQASETMVGVDCNFLDAEGNALQNTMYWSEFGLNAGLDNDNTFTMPEVGPLHVVPSQMQFGPDASLPDNSSPGSWVSFSSSISRTSSPVTIDEPWLQGPRVLSPNSSPELACQSPM